MTDKPTAFEAAFNNADRALMRTRGHKRGKTEDAVREVGSLPPVVTGSLGKALHKALSSDALGGALDSDATAKALEIAIDEIEVEVNSGHLTITSGGPSTNDSEQARSKAFARLADVFWDVQRACNTDGITLRKDLREELRNLEVKVDQATSTQPRVASIALVAPDKMVLKKQDGLFHSHYQKLVKAMAVRDRYGNRKNIMISGPMGGGKSTSGKQAAELFDLPFRYIGQTNMPHDVLGYVMPVSGEYKATPFVETYLNGGVIYLEELDSWSANATLCLNPPLANGYITLPDGTQHDRHPDCIIVACTNTWGTGPTAEYVGRNRLDNAFLDRFGIKMEWPYDYELEALAADNADAVELVRMARFNAQTNGIRIPISPRCSIDIADMLRAGFTLKEAAEVNFLASADKAQRKLLLNDTELEAVEPVKSKSKPTSGVHPSHHRYTK